MKIRIHIVSALILCSSHTTSVHADKTTEDNSRDEHRVIEEVIVRGRAIGRQKIEFDELASVSHLNLEDLTRRQSNDVFEALDSVAGLSIEGGIRTRGKSFSIRGFSDNEDVLLIVDGVPQNFEKYRSGSSVEIETELLKEIAVFRGGSAVNQGAGYIGGAIQIETKDASDLLQDEQTLGATIKSGWHSNNEAQRYLLNVYATPSQDTDLIVSGAWRETDDFHLPDGESIPDSDEEKLSALAKFEWHKDDFDIGISHRQSDGEAREPFDPQSASPIFGIVRRESDEQATTLRLNIHPDNPWINANITIGTIDKTITDIGGSLTRGCPISDNGEPNYRSTACGFDDFSFDILSSHASNTFRFETDETQHSIAFGFQYTDEKRVSKRTFREDNLTPSDFNDDFLSATTNNPNQPPGTKITEAFYLDYAITWQAWKLAIAARYDDISVAADDAETQRLLHLRSNKKNIHYRDITPSAELSWRPKYLSLFYRYRENFRPPLADELYSRSLNNDDGDELITAFFNRCKTFTMFTARPTNSPSLDEFAGDVAAFLAALANFQALESAHADTSDAFKQENAFCADLYKPETSVTQETGVALQLNDIFNSTLTKAELKITYFDIHTERLVESIEEVNGEVIQPGEEFRYGFEIELALDADWWFAEFNYSNLKGYELGLLNNKQSIGRFPLNNPPPDTYNLTAGFKLFDSRFQLGLKSSLAGSRIINNETLTALARERDNQIKVKGWHTEQLFAQWYPNDNCHVNLTVNNLFNETYQLRGFNGGLGETAPGRDYRLSIEFNF